MCWLLTNYSLISVMLMFVFPVYLNIGSRYNFLVFCFSVVHFGDNYNDNVMHARNQFVRIANWVRQISIATTREDDCDRYV